VPGAVSGPMGVSTHVTTRPLPRREATSHDIAVVGMGCRFPKATGTDAYWRLLTGNIDAITEISGDRFDLAGHYHPQPQTPGRTSSRHGGFLDDPYGFDAAFFGISPLEARTMDPQQRLLLHVVWEALEDGGIRPSTLAGTRGGVFVGQATAEYGERYAAGAAAGIREAAGSRLRAVTAGRVSYALDLRGPSLVLDTACSSSLVAVHAARQSLLTGESDLAIAAGVNMIFSVTDAVAYSQAAMLAPDGRCKYGDARADGFVRSDGIGVVVLKRRADAERAGDPILALLTGSAVTNDGRGSGLLLQPAQSGQMAALREAARAAGVTPGQLDYVECHGTGTSVGDQAELSALAQLMAEERTFERPVRIGSVKSNIGHTEAAAGIAGLIKAVLIARHRVLPASLHVGVPHPILADSQAPIAIVRQNEDFKPAADTALLGVSSFGISGTNAHVIVREYTVPLPDRPPAGTPADAAWCLPADLCVESPEEPPGEPRLLLLSARTPRSLARMALSYAAFLEAGDGAGQPSLAAVCAAAATCRDHHPHRLWAVGRTRGELARQLRALAGGVPTADGGTEQTGHGTGRRIAFVFPGQGSQWPGMGRDLMRCSPAFRQALDRCDAAVRAEAGWSVTEVLTRADQDALQDIAVVQPVLWAMEIALAAHWAELGVVPDVCVGHSMGEAAAAYICGALSLADSAAVICRRSALMKRLAGQGGMLSVGLPAGQARLLAARHGSAVSVAVHNSPASTVLAGDERALARIAEHVRGSGHLAREIKVNVASHSPAVDPVLDDIRSALAGLAPRPVRTPMLSTVSCAPVEGPELGPAYWADNLRRPVRFAEAVRLVADQGDTLFVELSPHPVLTAAMEESDADPAPIALPTLRRELDGQVTALRALGRLFALGGTVDLRRWTHPRVRQVRLPPYAWDTRHYRSEGDPAAAPAVRTAPLGALAGAVTVHGHPALPPAAVLRVALDAAADLTGRHVMLEDVRISRSPGPPPGGDAAVRIALGAPDPSGGGRPATVTVGPGADPLWEARGLLRPVPDRAPLDAGDDVEAALRRCHRYLGPAQFRALAARWGFAVDPGLLRVTRLWRRGGESVARLSFPAEPGTADIEAALLPLLAALPQSQAGTAVYVPATFGRITWYDRPAAESWTLCRVTCGRGRPAMADIRVMDHDGLLRAEFRDVVLHRRPLGPGQRRGSLRTLPGPLLAEARRLRGLRSGRDPRGLPDVRELRRLRGPRGSGGPSGVDGELGVVGEPAGGWPPDRDARADLAAEAAAAGAASGPAAGTAAGMAGVRAGRRAPGDVLVECTAAVMETTPDAVDPRRSLRDQGVDSLLAVRINRMLLERTGQDIGAGRLLGEETVAALRRACFSPPART
jgi:acyl transferase domain-containing protein